MSKPTLTKVRSLQKQFVRSNAPKPTQPIAKVPQKPTGFEAIPPVRRPVTGPPAVQGYPDGTKGNQLGPKPVGKSKQ